LRSSVKSVSEKDATENSFIPANIPGSQNKSRKPLRDLHDRAVGRLKGALRSFHNCERSAKTDARSWSKASRGVPFGFAGVLTISGGTAPISTAAAKRSMTTDVARPLRPQWSGRHVRSNPSTKAAEHPHTCSFRCRSRAGWSGHARGARFAHVLWCSAA
jgi:hypothetical protein